MNSILIANRGEIAVRIIRTCRDMGLATVAVYSECDRRALHVRLADSALAIGPDQASESYLRIDKLIEAARRSGADAIHPGYGFLAENPALADACAAARLTFIGPDAKAMRAMGSKTGARAVARRAGVAILPGSEARLAAQATDAELAAAAGEIGYPLLVKAVAGGGGKGMRVVRAAEDLASAVRLARSEAQSAFGDDGIYFERLLERPRHIEVQLLGDLHGSVVAFVERECSIQRRHQKLIEETPSPAVTPQLRAALMNAAAAIGRAAGYASAGTVEFLVDASGDFYFLEMNTRLQVEHPITEAITGLDLVRAQIEVARGARAADVLAGREGGTTHDTPNGHAIECRVYAENPEAGFLPSPGLITRLRAPSGPGIRDDGGAFEGWTVPTAYDPLISKVTAWAPDRAGAIARMVRALAEYDIRGVSTTIGFCRGLIASDAFAAGDFDTTTVDRMLAAPAPAARNDELEEIAAIAAALFDAAAAGPKAGTTTDTQAGRDLTSEPDAVPTLRPAVRRPESLWAQRARLEGLR